MDTDESSRKPLRKRTFGGDRPERHLAIGYKHSIETDFHCAEKRHSNTTIRLAAVGCSLIFLQACPALLAADEFSTGTSLYSQRQFGAAVAFFQGAVKTDRQREPLARYYLANCLVQLNRIDEAIEEYKRSYQLNPTGAQAALCLQALQTLNSKPQRQLPASIASAAASSPKEPGVIQTAPDKLSATRSKIDDLLKSGYEFEQQKRFNEAEHYYVKGLLLAESLGSNSQYLANAVDALAGFYFARKQYDKAMPLFTREFAIQTALNGRNSPETLRCKRQIAQIDQAEGDLNNAMQLFQEILLIREEQFARAKSGPISNIGQLRAELAGAHDDVASVYFQMNRSTEGSRHSETARQLRLEAEEEYTK